MAEVATPNQAEREFETGTDESFKNANAIGSAAHNENQRVTFANIKRTYDVYQDLDIQAARQALALHDWAQELRILQREREQWMSGS
jgi:hypothetical protein